MKSLSPEKSSNSSITRTSESQNNFIQSPIFSDLRFFDESGNLILNIHCFKFLLEILCSVFSRSAMFEHKNLGS